MSNEDHWRWADPTGQQRLVRTDELRAALASGDIPSNAPVWRRGWPEWRPAREVPELQSAALAAHNGLLPNIPPPPSFVVAAQTRYEGAPRVQPITEPPPPPRYAPASPVKASAVPPPPSWAQPTRAEPAATPPPSSARPSQRPPPPLPARATKAQTLPPPGPASKRVPNIDSLLELDWSHASDDPTTGVTNAPRQASVAAPTDLPHAEAKAPRIRTPINMPAPPPFAAPPMSLARPAPSPATPMEIQAAKSPTLMLYGGEPGETHPFAKNEAPHPIVVPPPAPAETTRNAVTRPPPWMDGAAHLEPLIPRPGGAPETSSMDPRPRVVHDSNVGGYRAEELSVSDLGAEGDAAVRPAPLAPASLAGVQVRGADDLRPSPEGPRRGGGASDATLARNRPARTLLILGAVIGAPFAVVGVALLLVLSTTRPRKPYPVPTTQASAHAASGNGAAPALPPLAAAEPVTQTSRATASTCATAGAPRILAAKALIGAGVEARSGVSGLSVGFAVAPKEGAVLFLDPVTLETQSTVKIHTNDSVRRIQAGVGATPTAVADADKRGDKLQGRRTVIGPSRRFDVGAESGALWWAKADGDRAGRLFALPSAEPVEALRGASLAPSSVALTFRQGKAVLFGVIAGEPLALLGEVSRVETAATQVGAPALAVSGGSIALAWAEKSNVWTLKLTRASASGKVDEPKTFNLPPGGLGDQVISPSLTSIPSGGFLLTWTEGPATSHQVRAIVLDDEVRPMGDPMTVSATGVNAGQGQAAVRADGRGFITFLAQSGPKAYQVVAAPVECHGK